MSTREQILALFEKNKGTYFSGEEIAGKLSVSRAAVWKAVKSLQNEGYCIDAVRNKGYCLSVETDMLSVQGIQKYLSPLCQTLELEVVTCVESTNTLVRRQAEKGAPQGYVLIAAEQTGGRGRGGHNFFSPVGTGVYFSLVLRPENCTPDQARGLTTMAAVAVCEAIEAVGGSKARIKGINDILVEDKKVCGILTEASFGLEDEILEYAVLGIGINVSAPKAGFPKELQQIAGAVFDRAQRDGKNRMTAEILNRFMEYYVQFPGGNHREQYQKRRLIPGEEQK